MAEPKRYAHIYFILSELLCMATIILMIYKYVKVDWFDLIWTGSKILTVTKLIKNNNTYPILKLNEGGQPYMRYNKNIFWRLFKVIYINIINIRYEKSYEKLLWDIRRDCSSNLKKCGILDSFGNIMCISIEDEYPINDIIIDSISNASLYS